MIEENDIERNFGIEPSEVKTIKDSFNENQPPAIQDDSDYVRLIIWLGILAQRKQYSFVERRQTQEKEDDNALWSLAINVPDKEGLIRYFRLLEEYQETNTQDLDSASSCINIEVGSVKEEVNFGCIGEIIIKDGYLLIPNDTLHQTNRSSDKITNTQSTMPKELQHVYDQLYKRLTTRNGIPLGKIHAYSRLKINHCVSDNGIEITLTKGFQLNFEEILENSKPGDLKYVKLNIFLNVKKPELLRLMQLTKGLSSREVLAILNGYIPLSAR